MVGLGAVKTTGETCFVEAKLGKIVLVNPKYNSFIILLIRGNSRLMKLKRVNQQKVTAFKLIGTALNAVFNAAAYEKVNLVKVVLMNGDTLKLCITVVENLKFTV